MKTKLATGVTRGAVLSYLQREADLDGLVTVAGQEIADRLDITQTTANKHITQLVADGFLTYTGRTKIRGHAISCYQLSEQAMA